MNERQWTMSCRESCNMFRVRCLGLSTSARNEGFTDLLFTLHFGKDRWEYVPLVIVVAVGVVLRLLVPLVVYRWQQAA